MDAGRLPVAVSRAVQAPAEPPTVLLQWRRRRDSNPRYQLGYSGFQDHRLKPLGHSSVLWNPTETRGLDQQ